MNYYLVDCENINIDTLNNRIKKNDKVICFYSSQCKKLPMDFVEYTEKIQAKLSCINVQTGTKNALDFQLSSYLGYLIAQNKKHRYYIVSNDTGYNCLCNFWKKENITIQRIGNTKVSPKKTHNKCIQKISQTELNDLLSYEDNPVAVYNIVNNSKTKTEINNKLQRLYKNNKRASNVYKKVKKLIRNSTMQ